MEFTGGGKDIDSSMVLTSVKTAECRNDPPFIWVSEMTQFVINAGGEIPSTNIADGLVSPLCFQNNTPYLWKLLDQALASRLISPLHALALLTRRVVPNRRAYPEAYRLYLELLGKYAFAPQSLGSGACRDKIVKFVNEALKLSQMPGASSIDSRHFVILFHLKITIVLLDSILEDYGLQYSLANDEVLYNPDGHQSMDVDGMDNSGEAAKRHHRKLKETNPHVALEVLGNIVSSEMARIYFRLIHLNMPELFDHLLKRFQFIEAHKSTLQCLSSVSSMLGQLATSIHQLTDGTSYLKIQQLSGALVDVCSCEFSSLSSGVGRSASWIPFDIFMENAMDAKNFHAISSITILAEVTKTLQVINRATWQETFQALWISALRLVQRDCEPPEGPIPHLDARLCMLLSIVPLAVCYLLEEEAEVPSSVNGFTQRTNYKYDVRANYVSIRDGLVYSLQAIAQYTKLLSPPPSVIAAANDAASKAAAFLFNFKKGNGNWNADAHNDFSVKAAGSMLHLIVEACLARKLIDTSAYFWCGYVVISSSLRDSTSIQESPWSQFMKGTSLTDSLRNALVATPASSIPELEKLYHVALNGREEEKSSAARILCGASLIRGWNIQEHAVHIVVKLLSPPMSSGGAKHGDYLISHMPMLNSIMMEISSVDIIHILSLYGMIPEVAAALMPLCEAFGSLSPTSEIRTSPSSEISPYLVFSCAFLFLLRLWKFYRPPQEECISGRDGNIKPQLALDYLLLLRNNSIALQKSACVSRLSYATESLNVSSCQPVYIDSFPKLRAWHFQNQACVASTLSGLSSKIPVHQVANRILTMIFQKLSRGGGSYSNISSSSGGSTTELPSGAGDDGRSRPMLPAWDNLEAIPFVLEALLTACGHGRISSRELTTGLRELVDFLPASLGTIISYFSAEISRGIWKPVPMNGTDWPSPAANLLSVESEIQAVLESAGVHIPRYYSCGTAPVMLPLPMAVLVSLTITFKLDRNLEYMHGIIGQALEHCSTGFTWPSMPIIGALWTQKARRWHDFIILSCARSPFTQDKEAITQLVKSCFSSFLGSTLKSHSHLGAHRGVNGLLGQRSSYLGSRLQIRPGFLYLRSCRVFHDPHFANEMIFRTVIDWAYELARECTSGSPARLHAERASLGSAIARVKEVALLGASLFWITGGLQLVQTLYEETLPTFILSKRDMKVGEGATYHILEGYVMAYMLFLSGSIVWGTGDASLAYASIFSSRQVRSFSIHMDFVGWVLEGNVCVGCDQVMWKAYVLCLLSLVVEFMPMWFSKVKQNTLQKLVGGLRNWRENNLAVAVLERGGLAAIATVVESMT